MIRRLLAWFSRSTTSSKNEKVEAFRRMLERDEDVQYDLYRDRVEHEVILDDHGYPLISIGKNTK